MAKPKNSSAATGTSSAEEPQKDAAPVSVITEPASSPSGQTGPEGTNTQESEGSDAAGKAGSSLTEPVKLPQEMQPAEAMVAQADQASSIPSEPEASGSEGAAGAVGPRLLSEVRYRGKTYRPGENLPGEIDPDLFKIYRAFGAI